MLNWFRKNRKSLIVTDIASDDLPWVADIHASGFSKAWSDGAMREMLAGKGVVGLLARSASSNQRQGSQDASSKPDIWGFVIFRVVADEAEIITIATAKAARRRGVAKALLDEMIRRCLADRLSSVFLEVDETNQAAIDLYRRFGFKQAGVRRAYYSQLSPGSAHGKEADALAKTAPPAHDAIVMRLSLDE